MPLEVLKGVIKPMNNNGMLKATSVAIALCTVMSSTTFAFSTVASAATVDTTEKVSVFPTFNQFKSIGIFSKRAIQNLDINLEMEQDAIDLISKEGIDLEYGARPLKRAIQNNLENELSELILQRTIKPGDDVVASAKDGKMVFNVK